MSKQLVITIGREYGSGGHEIASRIAEKYGIPLYDKEFFTKLGEENGYTAEQLDMYDEVPVNRLRPRNINAPVHAGAEAVAMMQFEFLQNKADAGESFAVVGRCAESLLRGYSGYMSFFILGDAVDKAKRIAKRRGVSEEEALALCHKTDHKRKSYHNYYCEMKWGDSRLYDLTVNSSRLGIDGTVELLSAYIEKRK